MRAACGVISRADLLRGLAVRERTSVTLEHSSDVWWGYLLQVQPPQDDGVDDGALPPDQGGATPKPTDFSLPKQVTSQWLVTRDETPPAAPQAQPLPVGAPMTEADARAECAESPVTHQDLLPWARLLPALLKPTRSAQARGVDAPRWVNQWAQRERAKPWPHLTVQRLPQPLIVVLDFSERLWPYFADMHRLCRQLLALCGQNGVSLRVLGSGPAAGWTDWVATQNKDSVTPRPMPWVHPPRRSPVLLVSDLGAHARHTVAPQAWLAFVLELRRAKLKPLALCPLGADQLGLPVFQHLPLLRWSPDAAARFTHVAQATQANQRAQASPAAQTVTAADSTSAGPGPTPAALPADPRGLADLLAMMAVTRRIDPSLLRALRSLNPHQPRNAGLEAAAWNHPDADAASVCVIRPEALPGHQARFKAASPSTQLAAGNARQRHHSHLRAGVNHEENFLWHAHAAPAAQQLPALATRVEAARRYASQLLGSINAAGDPAGVARWTELARQWLWRADAAMAQAQPDVFFTLAAAVLQPELAQSGEANMPTWVDPATLHRFVGGSPLPAQAYWLVHDAPSNQLVLQAEPPQPRQSFLSGPTDATHISVQLAANESALVRLADGKPWSLGDADDPSPGPIVLRGEGWQKTVFRVERPRWLTSWSRHRDGVVAQCASPWHDWLELDTTFASHLFDGTNPDLPYSEYNYEKGTAQHNLALDQYGVVATLVIGSNTQPDAPSQSFRYLPPAQFTMGSPPGEVSRDSDEGPQHQVTLTQGLWLADTACTQGLWLAVMGGRNPSRFTGGPDPLDLPVENVSWDDVQTFLVKLQAFLPPGVEAVLPTEAEWEYACRAGGVPGTPFSFGASINPSQVNYDGNFPYNGAAKGQYRKKTVAVKTLPANAWGFYQMHGNVWEWCADARRIYTAEAVVDPSGTTGKSAKSFAVRGGSWSFNARDARSARRNVSGRDGRSYDLGFRFALRSKSQAGAGGPVLGGRSTPVLAVARDAAASAPSNSLKKKRKR